MGLAGPAESDVDVGFGQLPKQILETGFSFFVAVGHEEDSVVRELAGEAGEFFELFRCDFVAAEADGGDLKFVESHDVIHSFHNDDSVTVEGFFDPGFMESSGVAAVEFEASVVAGDIAVFAGLFAFGFSSFDPVVPFGFKVQVTATVADNVAAFVAVGVDEVAFAEQRATVARYPADAPFLHEFGRHPRTLTNILSGFGGHLSDIGNQVVGEIRDGSGGFLVVADQRDVDELCCWF